MEGVRFEYKKKSILEKEVTHTLVRTVLLSSCSTRPYKDAQNDR